MDYDAPAPRQTSEGWQPPPLPLSLVHKMQEELAHYMGPPWLMMGDWLVFGPENGNRIDILFEDDVGAEVSVRCDVREEAPQFLVLISDLVRFQGYRFFSPSTREFIEPELELILEAIRRSQA
jgi:hypothetical protein